MPLNLPAALSSTSISAADELLLDVAEGLHASALTVRSLSQKLRQPSRRVRDAIAALIEEGLVAPAGSGAGRSPRFTLTDAGVRALSERGRFPGDVVVLFTDLVASTQMISAHGEEGAHERRINHLALLRAAVLRAGGYEVKGLGDGIMVAFADPVAACKCATDMQRSVAADADGLGLRVGLHAGPVLRDGDDLYGTTVITASRLCDKAESGQTLISEAVVDAAGDAVNGLLNPVGLIELKGLSEPVDTYVLSSSSHPVRRGGAPTVASGRGRRASRSSSDRSAR